MEAVNSQRSIISCKIQELGHTLDKYLSNFKKEQKQYIAHKKEYDEKKTGHKLSKRNVCETNS